MIEGLKKLKCGNCGNEGFEVFRNPEEELFIECIECGSSTRLYVPQPKISMTFAPGSMGILYGEGD
jgi:uncharacterized Zn finger protein